MAIIFSTRVHSNASGIYTIDRAMRCGQVCSPESRKYDVGPLSADVIGEELCAERLLKPACLGCGGLRAATAAVGVGHSPKVHLISFFTQSRKSSLGCSDLTRLPSPFVSTTVVSMATGMSLLPFFLAKAMPTLPRVN